MHDTILKRVALLMEKWRSARLSFSSFLLAGFACVTILSVASFAQGDLQFENNFFVTGDYVVAGAYGLNLIDASGYTSGLITVPDVNPGITGTKLVPTGAQIVAASLYWQTVETTPGSGANGFFGPVYVGGPLTPYSITGVNVGGNNTVYWSSSGCTGTKTAEVVRTYRADVHGLLPQDAHGNVLANGVFQVTLPSTHNSTPFTLGATLVIIYRVLSPNIPLNSIVIYDGASSLTMPLTVQGFYDAAQKTLAVIPVSRLTYIVGSGTSTKQETVYLNSEPLPSPYGHEPALPGFYGQWDNTTWTFPSPYSPNPVGGLSASATTEVTPSSSQQGCLSSGAVILSTTVQNSDNDGLLDVWKANQGYCDVSVNPGTCEGPADPSWVALPGAKQGERDLFVQLDHLCSTTNGSTCDNRYSFDPFSISDPSDGLNSVEKVVQSFADNQNYSSTTHLPVILHAIDGNAIPELTCEDDLSLSPPGLCVFPNQPGVVAWPGGLVFLKNQPLNYPTESACESNPTTCIRRFQHGKNNSYHYALFAHGVGVPNWTLLGGTLANAKSSIQAANVLQSGHTVTFKTTMPHTFAGDAYCAQGRVTVAFAITNPSLNGTYCITVTGTTTFTIQVASSTNFTYTSSTDPNLAVISGQATTISGFSDIGGQNSLIGLGSWAPALQTWQSYAGTFMHELTHSLGRTHGGFYFDSLTASNNNYTPTIEANCKPNYQSVMNYNFQVHLLDKLIGFDQNHNPITKQVPDLSGQTLNNLSEGAPPASPGFSPAPAAYYNTRWYEFTSVIGGTAATQHCDGTPILSTDVDKSMNVHTGPATTLTWSSATGEDINFDGVLETVGVGVAPNVYGLRGVNDWVGTGAIPGIDLRQIGATGSMSTANGAGQFGVGGGGGAGELNQTIAESVTYPPTNLTATEGTSPRTIALNWIAPTFGQIGAYNIYRAVTGQTLTLLNTVTGNPPATTYTDTTDTCNPSGYSYAVTSVQSASSTNPGAESEKSNTVPASGQPLLTGCYTGATATTPPAVAASLAFTPGTAPVGANVSITWSLTDDFYPTGGTVSNTKAATLVAIGPIPSDPTCSTAAQPPVYLNYQQIHGSPYPQSSSVLSASGSGVTPTNPFQFSWNTAGLAAGCYFFELDTDSVQYQQTTSAFTLLIFVSDKPQIPPTTLPPGVVGQTYTNTIYESGGTLPFTWSYTGSLPSGITLGASTGTVSGTTCVAGNYSFTAKVTDTNKNYGTQGLTLQINQASTTTSVTSSLYPSSTYGQAVTFTATVAPQYSCTPTGTVTFYDGATAISGAINLSSATAMFTTAALQLAAGMHSIKAVYSGDSNFYATGTGGSTATVLSQVVNQATTTTSVTSAPNPSTYGQTVTFNATVAPEYAGTPKGTVTFYDGATAISGAISLTSATASYTTTALQLVAGTNSITAVYSGDSNFYKTGTGGSTATALSQTVKPAMTGTSVSSSLDPSTYGDLVTFTAIVSNASGTAATPTGSVQFVISSYSGSLSVALIACPAGAPAYSLCATTSTYSLTVSGSPHTVQANYINTDGDFLTSSGSLIQTVTGQAVQKADTTATLAVSSGLPTLGDTVSLTATVIDASGGSTGTPTGLVTFLDGTTPIGTGALNGGTPDQATFTTQLLSVGTHNLTVQYDGDANFNATGADAGSTATGTTEMVALRGTTTGVVLNPATVVVGQASTTTVTVTDNGITNPVGTADSWIATSGTPTVGTSGSTATLFADGMVLVAGGLNSGAAVNNAYIYNAVSKTFTATGSLNTARTGATATLLANGVILIAGGSSNGTAANALNTAELYNPVTGAFTVAGSGSGNVMQAVRFGATATLLTNGQVLIAGGENSGGALSSAELYNPATDTFTATGGLGTARYDAAALLLANGVLIAGGTGGSGTLNSAELYSAGAGTFAPAGTMTAPRTGATATLLLSGNVLIAGGSTDTAEIYNPTTPAFTAISSTLSYAPVNGTATLLPNGMVLLAGGTSSQTTELYDPDSDKFDATGNLLNTDQPSLTATLLNKDNVLITGLTSGGSPVADAELYTPSFDPLGTVGLTSSDTSAMPDSFGAACVLTISGGGVSTCTSTVTPGEVGTNPHTITGTYPADSVHSGNNGSAPLTVTKANTTTSVTSPSSPNPSTYGQAVTFTATVGAVSPGAGTPTGTVIFEDGVTPLAGSSTVALSGGTASFTTTALIAGPHSITAVYSDDPNFNASTATPLPQAVSPAMTATSVSSSLNPSTSGSSVTFTAIVSNASGTAATPTGSVQFVIDSGSPVSGTPSVCPGPPAYSLCATTSTSSLTVSGSPHSVQANYINADGDFTTSSGALSPGQTVYGPAISTTTLPNGQYSSPYAPLTLSVSGGTSPYTWSLGAGGVLPAGMTLGSSSGTISGTPGQAGQWSIPITVTDANSLTANTSLSLTIGLATGYAGSGNCYMPYPTTPMYYLSSGTAGPWSVTLPGALAGQMTFLGAGTVTVAGMVTTNGTTVTWSSHTGGQNDQFVLSPTPSTITINGVGYTVASVNSSTTLTLTSSAGVQTSPVPYSYTLPAGGNMLTGCLSGESISSGSYQLQFTAGASTFTLPLQVVAADTQDNGTVNVNSGGIVTGNDVPPSSYQQGVVTSGQSFTFLPGSYAADSGFSGSALFGFTGTAPQLCGTFGTLPNSLTASSQAGRYDIAIDGTTQTCPATAFPTTPAPIVFESVDALTIPALWGSATVSSVALSDPGNPSGAFAAASNVLEITSGTSPNQVTVAFSYTINDSGCPGCIDQLDVGLNTDPTPQTYAYSGCGDCGGSGSASLNINVPNTPGRYYIAIDTSEDYGFLYSSPYWWNGQPTPTRYIGVVDVW